LQKSRAYLSEFWAIVLNVPKSLYMYEICMYFYVEENAPNAKKSDQMSKFRPIWLSEFFYFKIHSPLSPERSHISPETKLFYSNYYQ
jgi:hypothetical protein